MIRFNRYSIILFFISIPLLGLSQNKLFFGDNKFVIDSLPKPISVIMTGPFSPIVSQIPVAAEYRFIYETTVAHNMSAMFGASYLGKSLLIYFIDAIDTTAGNPFIEETVVRGVRGQAGYKYFIFEDGLKYNRSYPQGIYIGPHVSYSTVKFSGKAIYWANIFSRLNYFNVNLMSGMQYVVFNKLMINIFTGIGYKLNTIYDNISVYRYVWKEPLFYWDTHPIFKHYKISFGFNVGYVLGRN
ncbi:MAG: hypothetical protein JKX95_04040 [Bacteroidia bacterium]|nr:hypothetical protein [Bacteroidia bacterium]